MGSRRENALVELIKQVLSDPGVNRILLGMVLALLLALLLVLRFG